MSLLAKRITLLGISLFAGLMGCSPLPYHFTDTQLSDDVLQRVQAQFHDAPPISITWSLDAEGFKITKAERDMNIKWFGDRAGHIFPVGSLFTNYLGQAQNAAFASRKGTPRSFKASITSAAMSYTMKSGLLLSYMDWVELTLTITTEDAGGHIQPITLRREVSITSSEATNASDVVRDRALRTVIQKLVFDYLDAVWHASVAR